MSAAAARTIELHGPCAEGETRMVLRLCALVSIVSVLVMGRRWDRPRNPADDLSPYQLLFRDLPSPVQRTFRQLQEGLTEAENRRVGAVEWPGVESLAADGIPPFSPDPTDRSRLRWSLRRAGTAVCYLGASADSSRPSFLLLIVEPTAGLPGDPANTPVDEQHHRLSDGTILHVSIWMKEGPVAADLPATSRPDAAGWRQIVIAPLALRRPQ